MARSQADFVSKIGIACEEADESAYWLELLVESGAVAQERVSGIIREANELVAIVGGSRITAKQGVPGKWNRQSTMDNRQS
jgi:four helix bundle protein